MQLGNMNPKMGANISTNHVIQFTSDSTLYAVDKSVITSYKAKPWIFEELWCGLWNPPRDTAAWNL